MDTKKLKARNIRVRMTINLTPFAVEALSYQFNMGKPMTRAKLSSLLSAFAGADVDSICADHEEALADEKRKLLQG